MPNPRLAARYAKSLLDLAKEQNNVDVVLSDMKTIETAVNGSAELKLFLKSPLVKADKKISVLNAIFEGKISTATTAFISLLVKKGREAELLEMTTAFEAQYQALNNIQTVQITTAYPLDEATLNVLLAKVKKELNNEHVIPMPVVDPSIIGGFKLQIGDKYFDMSISRDLSDIRNQFTKNIYVADI
ncbi:MAG: ATP synthase F1 subunit delta [Bacteroidetes bacterium 43-16]|nr:MAG: ATP synthase F1 subunit delta [Bacteroidetes bacterium 43-16]